MELSADGTGALTDPLRAYVITLRKLAKLDQDEVASLIGVGYRTYMAWETGETKDIKLPVIRKLINVLGGAFQHLEHIDALTAEDAARLAENWHKLSADERESATRGGQALERIVRLTEDDPEKLEYVLRRLRDEAREDAELLNLVNGYLDGYRAAANRARRRSAPE